MTIKDIKENIKEMEHDFTIIEIDGLMLINPSEIGAEVCMQHLESEEIWQSDLIYDITLYFNDIIDKAFDKCEETLHNNNRKIDVFK